MNLKVPLLTFIFLTFLIELVVAIKDKNLFLIEATLWFCVFTVLLLLPSISRRFHSASLIVKVVLAISVVLFGTVGLYYLNEGDTFTVVRLMRSHFLPVVSVFGFLFLVAVFSFFISRQLFKKQDKSH